MSRRPRLLLAGLGVAVAAGLALGFTLTRGGPENAFAQGPPGVLASGELKTVSWGTNGTVTVERTRTGKVILRFSRDFRTQRAPALYVHMGSRRMVLQRPWGEQIYVLSAPARPRCTRPCRSSARSATRPGAPRSCARRPDRGRTRSCWNV